MKKIIFLLLISTSVLSCTDNDLKNRLIVDWDDYYVSLIVNDANGNNMLDPANEHNILGNAITVSYDSKTYPIIMPTEFGAPREFGLSTAEGENGVSRLTFGKFSPGENHRNKSLTINWGDGTTTEVKFDLYATWEKERPMVHEKLYVNGKVVSNDNLLVEIEIAQRTLRICLSFFRVNF